MCGDAVAGSSLDKQWLRRTDVGKPRLLVNLSGSKGELFMFAGLRCLLARRDLSWSKSGSMLNLFSLAFHRVKAKVWKWREI